MKNKCPNCGAQMHWKPISEWFWCEVCMETHEADEAN